MALNFAATGLRMGILWAWKARTHSMPCPDTTKQAAGTLRVSGDNPHELRNARLYGDDDTQYEVVPLWWLSRALILVANSA